jgi:hypothetical protein
MKQKGKGTLLCFVMSRDISISLWPLKLSSLVWRGKKLSFKGKHPQAVMDFKWG